MSFWERFENLTRQPLLVAKVVAHNADGTSTVQFPNLSTMIVRGQGVPVDGFAFIQGGEVRGPAPAVAPITLEV